MTTMYLSDLVSHDSNSNQDLYTQAQTDDSEYTRNAGHSPCAQKLSIIESDISSRTVDHQRRSIRCGWRGEGVMRGRRMDVDVPEREARGGHDRGGGGCRRREEYAVCDSFNNVYLGSVSSDC